jgi:hypothetical protein
MNAAPDSPAARALQAAKRGDWDGAAAIVSGIVRESFGLQVESAEVSRDGYSLNSVNGLLRVAGEGEYFFKFHHEEGEERTLQELYRGELLREAGYPVDVPVHVSRKVGHQLLLYRRRQDRRLVEVCAELDFRPAGEAMPVTRAQRVLDSLTRDIYLRTLHPVAPAQAAAEPINQLFHHRLVDPGQPDRAGGRARRFFWGRDFDLAGTVVPSAFLRAAHWELNGVRYADSIGALIERSIGLLEPRALARFGGVTAHGDAHNANVWWEQGRGGDGSLSMFDPAFAGTEICALLAEVKATFHNVLAHPLWLYSPARLGEHFRVAARIEGATIRVETDWQPSPLRVQFLQDKADIVWRPLLRAMAVRGLLAPDWRASLRCALFCCPTLVMDLCAGGSGGHVPASSALGLAVAVMAGSEPTGGKADRVSAFLDSIAPEGPDGRR